MNKEIIQQSESEFINAVKGLSEEERNNDIELNYDRYLTYLPNGEYKKILLKKIYTRYLAGPKIETEVEIGFTQNEIDFLKALPTDEIKRLFYSLMVKSKVRPHSSGWIRLDFEETLRYGFTESKAKKIKLTALSQCREFGFDARVVGSNMPVLCFKLPIIASGEDIITFGSGKALEMFGEVVK